MATFNARSHLRALPHGDPHRRSVSDDRGRHHDQVAAVCRVRRRPAAGSSAARRNHTDPADDDDAVRARYVAARFQATANPRTRRGGVMLYAQYTEVPVSKTRAQIEQLLDRHKAKQYGTAVDYDLMRARV